MARQGYDDTDNISQVEALMRSEPGLTRQAAIKRVVGTNKSNVRRIETKMKRIAAEAPPPFPTVKGTLRPVVPERWSESRFATLAVLVIAAAGGIWLLWPEAYLYAMLGVCWLQFKLAILMTGPLSATGAAALTAVERLLATGDFGVIDSQMLKLLRYDVSAACRTVLASAVTATMAWSVWMLASLPSDRDMRPTVFSRGLPSGERLGETLGKPRNAMVAAVLLGGLGCIVPALADFALLSVAMVTLHCTGRPTGPMQCTGEGRRSK